jgi:acetate---CoA ligase (ADP-forming) subunit alpha
MKINAPRPYIADCLRFAFAPRRIAVVGASRHPEKAGFAVVKGLLDRKYPGEILPVNPHADRVQGLRAYKDLRGIAGGIDLVFVTLPAAVTPAVVEECAAKGVRAVAIASGGFREAGQNDLEAALISCCRAHQVALFGPNLLALGNPYADFNCGLAPYTPTPGPVAVISQSGANLLALLGASTTGALGVSFYAGLGNKADVDFSELIEYAGQDHHTRCVALYVEGLDSEEAFTAACRAVVPTKPILVLKAGTSALGWSVAMAHTASNPGTVDNLTDRLFHEAGAVRVRTLGELIDGALALSLMPRLKGDHVVIVTNGGGSGLLLTDEFEHRGMPLRELAQISPRLRDRIGKLKPRPSSYLNPIDLGAAASSSQYREVVNQLLADPDVHGVVVSICPTLLTRVSEIVAELIDCFHSGQVMKPVIAEIQGGADCDAAILELRLSGIPAYPTPERAVAACRALRLYARQCIEITQGAAGAGALETVCA